MTWKQHRTECSTARLLGNKFEDAKGVIRRRKSKKNRQHNGQKKKDKHRYTYLHRKLKIEQHEPH